MNSLCCPEGRKSYSMKRHCGIGTFRPSRAAHESDSTRGLRPWLLTAAPAGANKCFKIRISADNSEIRSIGFGAGGGPPPINGCTPLALRVGMFLDVRPAATIMEVPPVNWRKRLPSRSRARCVGCGRLSPSAMGTCEPGQVLTEAALSNRLPCA